MDKFRNILQYFFGELNFLCNTVKFVFFPPQPTGDSCRFNINSPLALDDIEDQGLSGDFRIHIGLFGNGTIGLPVNNFITASVAVVVESFSFVFVAFTDPNGDSFIIGVGRCMYVSAN